MGAVRKMPWEYQDEVALRQVMTLSLSFDHRLVDGEQGSRFLADVGAILADPGMAWQWSSQQRWSPASRSRWSGCPGRSGG